MRFASTLPKRGALLWLALAVAFSPVFVDLARALAETTRSLSVLLAPLLFVLAARRDLRSPPRADGLLLLGLGVLLEIIGVAAGSWSLARLGLPLAITGLARSRGFPPTRTAVLSFWLVPVPVSLLVLFSPELESKLAALGAAVVQAAGSEVEPVGPLFTSPQGRLEFTAADGGLPLATTLAALGWYAALRRDVGLLGAALGAGRWALWAVVVQPAAACCAVAAFSLGAPDFARVWLTHGTWLTCAAVGLAWIERHTAHRT